MGRIINGIYFENNDSKNGPVTEAIINKQDEDRIVRRIVKQVKRELELDEIRNIRKQKLEKSLRKVVDEAAETIEKEFEKHGGTVSR